MEVIKVWEGDRNWVEESQTSSLHYTPLAEKDGKFYAYRHPFQCREFLTDWQYELKGGVGRIYRMSFGAENNKYLQGYNHTHLLLCVDASKKDEVKFMDELFERVEVKDEEGVLVTEVDCMDDGWGGENDRFIPVFYTVEVPKEYLDKPLALSFWILGIRTKLEAGDPEAEDVFGFGIPEPAPDTNGSAIINQLRDINIQRIIAALYEYPEYLWSINKVYHISSATHEALSPVSLLLCFSSQRIHMFEMHFKNMKRAGKGGDNVFAQRQSILQMCKDKNITLITHEGDSIFKEGTGLNKVMNNFLEYKVENLE